VRYNEFFKCTFERGEGAERCAFYKRAYESLCPAEWVEEWQELREKGLWWVLWAGRAVCLCVRALVRGLHGVCVRWAVLSCAALLLTKPLLPADQSHRMGKY
jgi:hypothetical protein